MISRKLLTPFVFATALVLAGCGATNNSTNTTSTESAPAYKDNLKIGFLLPLSGPGGKWSEDIVPTYEETMEEFKLAHPDKTIEAIYEDAKCNGKDATSAAQKLINVDQVDVIIGGFCSAETAAAGKIAQANKTLIISPLSASSSISEIGEYMFRFNSNVEYSRVLAEYIGNRHERVLMIVEQSEFPVDLSENFKKKYPGTIVETIEFAGEEADHSLIAKQVAQKTENFDALVIFTAHDDATVEIVKEIQEEGVFNEMRENTFTAAFFSTHNFLSKFDPASIEGIKQVNFGGAEYATQKGRDYLVEYKKNRTINSFDLAVLLGKETIDVILDGFGQGIEPKKFLESIDKDNQREGYFGNYYFQSNGDAKGLTFVMQEIKNGEAVDIK